MLKVDAAYLNMKSSLSLAVKRTRTLQGPYRQTLPEVQRHPRAQALSAELRSADSLFLDCFIYLVRYFGTRTTGVPRPILVYCLERDFLIVHT